MCIRDRQWIAHLDSKPNITGSILTHGKGKTCKTKTVKLIIINVADTLREDWYVARERGEEEDTEEEVERMRNKGRKRKINFTFLLKNFLSIWYNK